METDDIIFWLFVTSSGICFILSIVVACRKLKPFDRGFPILWQIIFWILFVFPLTHGFPSEAFNGMVFAIVWTSFALVSSCRLYKIKMPALQVFAASQFIQSVCLSLLSVLEYASACWRYYGHVVWNP